MTDKTLWEAFVKENPDVDAQYEAWAFGVDADNLGKLVLTGEKTATASAYPLYQVDGEDLPEEGQYSVILDSQDNALCIIQTTKVSIVPFCDVTANHAYKEGEGDRSLAYWRQVHKDYFSRWMEEAGLTFAEEMPVVCEEFTVVYTP